MEKPRLTIHPALCVGARTRVLRFATDSTDGRGWLLPFLIRVIRGPPFLIRHEVTFPAIRNQCGGPQPCT